jgi:hypothetical protein
MKAPNLSNIIDTYIEISLPQPMLLSALFQQIKEDLIPHVRNLQEQDHIGWFCFLIHSYAELHGREPESNKSFIHIKLSPQENINDLMPLLPKHFKNPKHISLEGISGIDKNSIKGKDWSNAWKIHGQASELVFSLLENHDEIPLTNITQFLHFVTNPLGLGFKCRCSIPGHEIPF